MSAVLPDSKGEISKILFHHTSAYRYGKPVRRRLFAGLIESLSAIGSPPEVFIFATHRNEAERKFLENEAEAWKPFVRGFNYVNVMISPEMWSTLPYAQDTCIVLDSERPSAIMTKSPRYKKMQNLIAEIEKLLQGSGLTILRPEGGFNLEGGFVYGSTKALLYSNENDRKVLENLTQNLVFVDNSIGKLAEGIADIILPGRVPYNPPAHIDLMFSIFEKEDDTNVFLVDFKDAVLSMPFLSERHRILLKRRLQDWDNSVQKTVNKIREHHSKVCVHKVPGVIGFERDPHHDISFFAANALYVYSGANLLFHSKQKDYAFYLKFPSEDEDLWGFPINDEIESALRNANIIPIPLTETDAALNHLEIHNSAGPRCLVKILSRDHP